jgi:hypothetical protein
MELVETARYSWSLEVTNVATSERILFVKFQEREILEDLGRIIFAVISAFSTAGYKIQLFNNIDVADLKKYGSRILDFENLTLTSEPPSVTEAATYLFDKEDAEIGRLGWLRRIKVRFDVFSSYRFQRPVIMPFPVHPNQNTPDLPARLKKLRSTNKNMKVFFSGDTKEYKKLRVRYPKTKIARLPLIKYVIENMTDNVLLVSDKSDLERLPQARYIDKCVIVDTNQVWVKDKDWLPSLARAHMFLCLPGALMPMCHNATEAMAVGTIPITNYPEWFDPDLIHMENCIVFDDEEDLIEKLKLVMDMDQGELSRIRENAIDYYETYLRSASFIHRIESHEDSDITVLILTGFNVRNNASRLNKNSILIRGTTSNYSRAWYEKLFARLLSA